MGCMNIFKQLFIKNSKTCSLSFKNVLFCILKLICGNVCRKAWQWNCWFDLEKWYLYIRILFNIFICCLYKALFKRIHHVFKWEKDFYLLLWPAIGVWSRPCWWQMLNFQIDSLLVFWMFSTVKCQLLAHQGPYLRSPRNFAATQSCWAASEQ
jgi:hypothetical protein